MFSGRRAVITTNWPKAGVYNGYLCSTSDQNVWFGTHFSADTGCGDYWAGFVVTANYGKTATGVDYANQFMAWADKGAKGSSNCMIGFFDGYTKGYAIPTIEFVEPRQVRYLYMANTAITYPYEPMQVDAASYYYKVKITGSLESKETGSVECTLIEGAKKVSDWKMVDLSALGEVDCLTFSPDSNEANEFGLLGLRPILPSTGSYWPLRNNRTGLFRDWFPVRTRRTDKSCGFFVFGLFVPEFHAAGQHH